MAQNFYEGWTEDQLIAERRKVQLRISRGDTIEAAGAGVKSTKAYPVSAQTVLENIQYSLYLLDPVSYPLNQRNDRTKAVMYG